jgi:hypothetical protein
MRLFPGNIMQATEAGAEDDSRGNVAEEPATAEAAAPEWMAPEPSAEAEVVDGDVVQEMNAPTAVVDIEDTPQAAEAPAPAGRSARGGRGRGRGRARPQGSESPQGQSAQAADGRPAERRASRKEGAVPKARKAAPKPRAPRTRARKETPVA